MAVFTVLELLLLSSWHYCHGLVPQSNAGLSLAARTSTRRGGRGTRRTSNLRSILDSSIVQDLIGTVGNFYKESPVEAAFVTCGVKAASSDAIAQRAVEKRTSGFAYKRNAAFIAYGGFYQGLAQYYIFNKLYPFMFGDGTDILTVAEKVIFDQLVLTPFVCLPIAYIVKAAVFGYSIPKGLTRYVDDAKRDLLWKYWAIWTPTQCITFSIVPEHLRIPFIAAVSFFWLILLSSITSRSDVAQQDDFIIICYDNECLIMDRLRFVGPSSLINEDGSSTGVQLQPGVGKVSSANLSVGPSSLVNEKDASSIGVEVPAGVEVVPSGGIAEK